MGWTDRPGSFTLLGNGPREAYRGGYKNTKEEEDSSVMRVDDDVIDRHWDSNGLKKRTGEAGRDSRFQKKKAMKGLRKKGQITGEVVDKEEMVVD